MIDFPKCFELLTDNSPFAWQIRLYEKFLADEIPSACDIPTGLGKTSVIAIWLLALAENLIENPQTNKTPRRLVYVVDRRVIVDQATDEAEKILCNLKKFEHSEDEELRKIFSIIQDSSFLAKRLSESEKIKKDDANVVALSTLRGEFADNRKWCEDPSRPAIIVGTIDMIGSRLLFSAYGGVGESYKALQAGLLGQDSLIIVDEAHLSPAFVEMLESLPGFINRKSVIKRFEVMQLSATLKDKNRDADKILSLEKDAREDLTNKVAAPRLNAEKLIEWQNCEVSGTAKKEKTKDKKTKVPDDFQAEKMAKVAAQYKDLPVSVIVFGRTVELVKKIQAELIDTHKIEKEQVLLMIGGMRGFERDDLVNHKVFEQFDPNRTRGKKDKASFLVATSVAEVGVNLDADFAVCDETSADSFVQRLGRVNRFGNVRKYIENNFSEEQRQKLLKITNDESSSVVSIVCQENSDEQKPEIKETSEMLKRYENGKKLNASPIVLRRIKFSDECNPPKPVSPPLDSARIDDWAMTSLKQNDFRRPLVSYWLRGVTVDDYPETSLCWRADFKHIVENTKFTEDVKKNKANEKKIRQNLIASVKAVRVKSRECARETTKRAENAILKIAEKFLKHRVVIISAANEYEVCLLEELKDNPDLYKKLMFATVVLPCEVGGLERGIVVEDTDNLESVPDVVEIAVKEFICENENKEDKKESKKPKPEWLRIILTENDGYVSAKPLNQETNPFENERYDSFKDAIAKIARAEKRKNVKTIDLGNFVEMEDEEETQKKRKISYLILKKSPDAYLPSEADNDEDTEDESASIGYEEGEIPVDDHNKHVAKFAGDLAKKLHLSAELIEALEFAGARHDKGKARQCWQNAVGNFEFPDKVLAKSNQNWFGHKYNNYYRHEFGSLIEAEESDELNEHPHRDLILHLIAAHHGYARPHFPERAFDKENPNAANYEVAERAMLRFANLQIKYGWWQLAYLEAILKAADALASRAKAEGKKI